MSTTRLAIYEHLWDEGDTTWQVYRQAQVVCDDPETGMEWLEWEEDETFDNLEFETEAEAEAVIAKAAGGAA